MQKNAREYVEDCCGSLHEAVTNLQSALQTVEKDYNRNDIQTSLQLVQEALQKCDSTRDQLAEH